MCSVPKPTSTQEDPDNPDNPLMDRSAIDLFVQGERHKRTTQIMRVLGRIIIIAEFGYSRVIIMIEIVMGSKIEKDM